MPMPGTQALASCRHKVCEAHRPEDDEKPPTQALKPSLRAKQRSRQDAGAPRCAARFTRRPPQASTLSAPLEGAERAGCRFDLVRGFRVAASRGRRWRLRSSPAVNEAGSGQSVCTLFQPTSTSAQAMVTVPLHRLAESRASKLNRGACPDCSVNLVLPRGQKPRC